MPLVRGHHSFDDHYAQIPNSWLRDARLSFKARGVLALIMSHRQGWTLSISALASQNREGKDAIRSAVQELEKFGYIRREQENTGRFGESVWITQDPSATDRAENPTTENPTTENPTPKNTITKEEQVKENNHAHVEELFTEFWNAYPRKLDKAKAFRAFKSALKRTKFEDILAGVIAYRNDPKRNPDFTKYPATWLNNDSWENAATTPETGAWRDKALRDTKAFLAEQEELAARAAPPPRCEHDNIVALCKICLAK